MTKSIKTITSVLLIFILLCSFNIVNATEDVIEDSGEESTETTIVEDSSDISALSVLSPSSGTNVSTLNSYEQANLSLNNILCILLIAIGILLILFSIAILIRLKK